MIIVLRAVRMILYLAHTLFYMVYSTPYFVLVCADYVMVAPHGGLVG